MTVLDGLIIFIYESHPNTHGGGGGTMALGGRGWPFCFIVHLYGEKKHQISHGNSNNVAERNWLWTQADFCTKWGGVVAIFKEIDAI